MIATLAWGVLLFGMPLDANWPLVLPLSLLVAVIGLGIMGMLLATTFVLYRHANALSNLLEYPVWIATGMLVPLALLPAGWARSAGSCSRPGRWRPSGGHRTPSRRGWPSPCA